MNQVKEAKQMASKQKKRHEDKLILSKFFGKNIVKGTFDQVQDISQAIEYHKWVLLYLKSYCFCLFVEEAQITP